MPVEVEQVDSHRKGTEAKVGSSRCSENSVLGLGHSFQFLSTNSAFSASWRAPKSQVFATSDSARIAAVP
jgi:hypothetical protein